MTTIYLAGGMKSGWQDRVIAALPQHTFIDPRTHGLKDELDYTEWDLRGIRESDLVLAYMDTDNPSGFGLNLEVGYATGIGRAVWYVCEDTSPRQRYFGMVRACAERIFPSLDEAIAALRSAVPNGVMGNTTLEPFLRIVAQLDEHKLPDDWTLMRGLTAGDIRAVASALGVNRLAGAAAEGGNNDGA